MKRRSFFGGLAALFAAPAIAKEVLNNTTTPKMTVMPYGSEFTDVPGQSIITGVIKSADSEEYFDLGTGEIAGRITFRAPDKITRI